MAEAVNVSPLSCAGPQACDIVNLYAGIFWIAMAVLVVVGGLIVYAALRFRRKDDREPSQDRGAFDHHLTTPHYRRWSAAAGECHAAPPRVVRGRPLFMTDDPQQGPPAGRSSFRQRP